MHQIVAAADQEVGGLAVILPPLYEIFWSALVLLIVLLLVGRYALPRIYQTMDERAAKIEEGLGAAEQAKAEQEAAAARDAASDAVASLPEVDFSVGKEAFVSEWTSRINAYLAGSPLAGQGATFAEAAWSNGVDPRWSPAISNTESSKGAHCFLPYNAWGWGDKSWSSWEEAINAHVAGLANGYGYSITYANAAKYCPPNTDHWFKATIGQMKMI